ncbi:MAG: PAS domain-containing sensor histidine kinase [Rectinemataceae bacterium]|nr:PAS domain-containing sensor histidine kinase [Rectinemataceae bacterium]
MKVTQMEQALQEKETLFRTLEKLSPAGIFRTDTQGNCTSVNGQWSAITGISSEQTLGNKWFQAIHPADREHVSDAWYTSVHDQKPFSLEYRFLRPDGVVIWVRGQSEEIIDESGRPLGCIGIITDITDRKVAEDALLKLNDTLVEWVKEEIARNTMQERMLIQQSRLAAMGELMHNISHHWRQPINVLALILTNIKDSYKYNELTEDVLEKYVSDGQRVAQKMSAIIDDFRRFFSPDRQKEDFQVCESVAKASWLVADAFKIDGIEIILEKSDKSCIATGYPNEFARAVVSTLTNAKESIVKQGRSGKIHIKVEESAGTATVSIRDNGGGVPVNILERVFEPYFSTKVNGAGIGLYMSKIILERMGGAIELHNVENGAELIISLPLV